jgi:hypothetical protein
MGIIDLQPAAVAEAPAMPEGREHPSLQWHWVFAPIGVFLAGFGLLNWAELPLGWKDRTEQITRYLDQTVGLGSEWVTPTLWTAKSLELALGIIAVVALARRDPRWLVASIVGWMTIFTVWTFIDVWAEDRAELQEHTVYFVVFTQLLAIVLMVSLATHAARWLRRTTEDPAP